MCCFCRFHFDLFTLTHLFSTYSLFRVHLMPNFQVTLLIGWINFLYALDQLEVKFYPNLIFFSRMGQVFLWCILLVVIVGLPDIYGPFPASGCNEAVCASIVSKCMLTQSCKCDLQNCTCCKECFTCLSYLYSECCSCVGKSSLV